MIEYSEASASLPTLVFAVVALGLLAASTVYVVLATFCVLCFRRRLSRLPVGARAETGITVLKPLCGMEEGLADNLRTFCRQDYGRFQIVFGVRDPKDPAAGVVEALQREFPDRDLVLVVDSRVIGHNLKVSNLANMLPAARHDLLVIADSDMRVRPDYLRAVAASFDRHEVGAATCLYSASARHDLASRLGAIFINDWFLPSALIPATFGKLSFCFGATMAVRRDVLAAMGGFEALAGFVADDYMLGQLVTRQKRTIALVPYIVENTVAEEDLPSLFQHEIRWSRTVRSVQPYGYALSFITELLPLALLAGVAVHAATASAALAAGPIVGALFLRLGLHYAVRATVPHRGRHVAWLVPVRDLLSLAVRVASYGGNTVKWREQMLTMRANSRIRDAH
ncbi:MAG: glycosyltransferase [Rhodospirillales bacterium]|nr:glycosyltransferase [Rhodospirillales bacterium]